MKAQLLLLCLAASAVCGAFTPGLRIRFDIGLFPGSTFFYDIPRSVSSVVSDGWVQVERATDDPLTSLVMYCMPDDWTLCCMYDDSGYIAGLQIALPVANFTDTPIDLSTIGFRKWSAPANTDTEAAEYWINQQYFVSEETLALSAESRAALRPNNETLYDGGVWVPDFDGKLTNISSSEDDIKASEYTLQACIPLMGTHYYYNMSSEIDCSALYPWFTLMKDDALVGTGFMVFGTLPEVASGKRDWFERPSSLAVRAIVPRAPECLYNLADQGLITMHIYYVNSPWTIFC